MNLMEKYLKRINPKVKPSLKDVITEKYQTLTGWLHSFDLTGDEIKETIPKLYQDIQDAIEKLDHAFANEDMPTFQDALTRIKTFYTEALLKCGRRIAVKVYSEILQAYLWVVDTDEDMHSQGVSEAIYTADEIKKLKGLSQDSLREIHKVKEVFENSKIKEITAKENHDVNR